METVNLLLAYLSCLFISTIAEKRILTNDPHYVQGIEAQFQDLKLQFHQLQTSNQAFETTIHGLQSNIVLLENKNQALETTVQGLQSNIVSLENKNQDLQNKAHGFESSLQQLNSLKGGDVYTRWGHDRCPGNNTELVYSGYAGGSWYDHSGGAAEYMCLPKDPINHTYFTIASNSFMYGAEYYGGSLNDQDVPCAVCRSSVYSTIVMIPARNQCYPGWVEQYHGMLSTGDAGSGSATEFVCLDAEAKAVPHGHRNENGRLFETVHSKCGSLPCPPYNDNTLLSCVVCAK